MEREKTFTKEYQESLQQELGVIYPWSCKDKQIQNKTYDGLLTDLETYWNQEARFREGFEFTDDVVTIPNFFVKITGVYDDKEKQHKLEQHLTSSKNTLYFENIKDFDDTLFNVSAKEYWDTNGIAILKERLNCSRKKVHKKLKEKSEEELMNLLFLGCSPEIRQQCIQKIKKFEKLYMKNFSKSFKYLLYHLILVDDAYINLLNSFDYTRNIPKIVIKQQEEEHFKQKDIMFLIFLNLIGFDIVILNPYGKNDFNIYMDITEFLLDSYSSESSKEKYDIFMEISVSGLMIFISFLVIVSLVLLIKEIYYV